jgi:PPE-repeat protein
MTASVGRAASLGVLSVPQGWATAAPAFSQVSSVMPSAGVGATPALAAANAANPGTMLPPPLANLAGRATSTPMSTTSRFDVRPAVVQRPVAAG